MKKRMRRWLLALLCLALLPLGGCGKSVQVSGSGFYFDTVVTLTLCGSGKEKLQTLLQSMLRECGRYESLLSKTRPDSDVSHINAAQGQTVTVDGETWAILKTAKEISEKTGGAFSVTIAPLAAQWDFTGGTMRMPTEAERLAALPLVDDGKLLLGEGNTVTLPQGMQIDLGGVAKGYIADRLADMARGNVTGALINIGGNVYALGTKLDGTPFRVGVTSPEEPAAAAALITAPAEGVTVVTSGTYQRRFMLAGTEYHHILNPDTGLPARSGLVSATVVGDNSMTADALATACIVLGLEQSVRLLADMGLEGLFIDGEGNVAMTPGFSGKYPVQLAQ